MGYYKVDCGDYTLCHSDGITYLNYFEFQGKKYPIGAYVKLTDRAICEVYRNRGYGFKRGDFRLVDHYFDSNGVERWDYIIGKDYDCNLHYHHRTTKKPDELISEVLWNEINETVYTPGELEVEFKEPNYFPTDNQVDGVIVGWFVLVLVWIGAFIFKDWWIRLAIQIGAGLYFGHWREKKINEAITTQKFKE